MSEVFTGLTPELGDVVRTIMNTMLLDVNVCMPGKIVKYTKATQYADVQPQLLQTWGAGSLIKFPIIPSVPVKHPRAMDGKAFIHMPLKPGDDVTLVFSQRSLDNWKSQGGMTNPNDFRKHHVTDAYALVGGSAIPDAFTPETDNAIEITNGQSSLQVFPDGGFKLKNSSNELVTLVQQIAALLAISTTNTIYGPMLLNTFEDFQILAEKIQTLVEG